MSLPQPECKSEVALLLARIEAEYQGATNGLNGLSSGSAKHEVITSKMERVAGYSEQLKTLVGEDQAIRLTVEAMNRAGSTTRADSSTSQA
ncbi:MAG: hypothetical protein E6J34_04320 [Chloroflexi bacterium]|nr:MAG: hypothetical protein E6J34_04320 [Chloroflexota bacterium]